jgi:hypothetical protein
MEIMKYTLENIFYLYIYIYIYRIMFRCLQKHLAECSMDIQSIIK